MSEYLQVSIKTAGEELNRLHAGIENKMRSTVADAIRAGEILSTVKGSLSHGDFLPWIKANCKFSERTANRYMSLHEYRSKTASVSDLQEAYRQVETLEAQAKQSESQRAFQRVKEYKKTGIKPDEWRRGTDDKLYQEEIDRDKRIQDLKDRIERESQERESKPKETTSSVNDMFADAMEYLKQAGTSVAKRIEFKQRIRLSHEGLNDTFIDALMDYLDELESDSRRIEVCHNIIKVCKGIANQLQSEANK
jgi:hypothetical protein